MKKCLIALAVLLAVSLAVNLWQWQVASHADEEFFESSTSVDTIPSFAPEARDSVVVRYVTEKVPVRNQQDSTRTDEEAYLVMRADSKSADADSTATIVIPITSKVYEDSLYRAYVSGYKANLDSIFINRYTETIHIREPTKAKRFSVGLQAGYGMTPKGFQPYLGVGVSVNLFEF